MQKTELRFLVVDDDEEDRMLLRDAFAELGHQRLIRFAEDGERALHYLTDCIVEDCLPQLLILDLNMPRLNGRQTLAAIKKDSRLKDITVVIYSTSLNPSEKAECLALGAYDYVIKPVSYKDSMAIARRFYELGERISEEA